MKTMIDVEPLGGKTLWTGNVTIAVDNWTAVPLNISPKDFTYIILVGVYGAQASQPMILDSKVYGGSERYLLMNKSAYELDLGLIGTYLSRDKTAPGGYNINITSRDKETQITSIIGIK